MGVRRAAVLAGCMVACTLGTGCHGGRGPGAASWPSRLAPLTITTTDGVPVAEAWSLFDRDTATGWAPPAESTLVVTLSGADPVTSVKMLGGSPYRLSVRGAGGEATSIDATSLGEGWTRVGVAPARSPVTIRVTPLGASQAIPELELWGAPVASLAPVTTESVRVLADDLTDLPQLDVVEATPADSLLDPSLAGGRGVSCAGFSLDLVRPAALYRRAWLVFESAGAFRPFVLSRRINTRLVSQGDYVAPWSYAETSRWAEPIATEWLADGANYFEFCIAANALSPAAISALRLVAETDNGLSAVETVTLADGADAAAALDGDADTTVDVSASAPLGLSFDRLQGPEAILLFGATTDAWAVSCVGREGDASPIDAHAEPERLHGALVLRVEGAASCRALGLAPAQGSAKLGDVRVLSSGTGRPHDWETIEIASALEHFGRLAWIAGWVQARTGDPSSAWLGVDGLDHGTVSGSFGMRVVRDGDPDQPWPVELSARFDSGAAAERRVVLSGDARLEIEAAWTGAGDAWTDDWDVSRFGADGETATAVATATEGGSLRLGRDVGVDVPPSGVLAATRLSVTHVARRALPALNPGMLNVTAPQGHAYEFLPHGQRFAKAVRVTMPFDPAGLPAGVSLEDVNTYYYDEAAARWEPLARTSLDAEAGVVVSATDHFTLMINAVVVAPEHPGVTSFDPTQVKQLQAANPAAGVKLIQTPTVGSSGDARLRYPIELPPGRAGMQPDLSLEYGSANGNGWLGLGWDLSVPSITVDTRWGAPRYDPALETETYLLSGEQLTPVAHRGTPVARSGSTRVFHARVEREFQRIVRHGDSPRTYWWELTDKNGTRYSYGATADSGQLDPTSVLASPRGVFRWPLREIRDLHDNRVELHYSKVLDPGVVAGPPGVQIYLSRVTYTGRGSVDGPYEVRLLRDRDLGEARRTDVVIDGRGGFKQVTADLLRRIEVRLGNTPVRSYDLQYETGAFEKTLLARIRQLGADGTEFPGNVHELHYYDDARASDGYGFDPPEAWNAGDDDVKHGILGQVGEGDVSVLGGSVIRSESSSTYVGGNLIASKTGSIGNTNSTSRSSSQGVISFIDLDGDGLPDKVFKKGQILEDDRFTPGEFYYRPNLGPGQGFGDPRPLVTLPAISKESSRSLSTSLEWHGGFPSASVTLMYSLDRSDTYLSDVNGDGLPDLVDGDEILFNHLDASGTPTFTADSGDTPVRILPGAKPLDTSFLDDQVASILQALLAPHQGAIDWILGKIAWVLDKLGIIDSDLDLGDIVQDRFDTSDGRLQARGVVDALRRWVAPMSGTIQVTGDVALAAAETDPNADGVRVAVQRNAEELWSAVIGPQDTAARPPTGLSSLAVAKGDRIYFRAGAISNGVGDVVNWSPRIQYLGVDPMTDADRQPVYDYQAATDFALVGRVDSQIVAPLDGTIRLEGDLTKLGTTTDDITVIVEVSGVPVITRDLLAGSTGTIAFADDLAVSTGDVVLLRIQVDSPIDVHQIAWAPRLYYTDSPDLPVVYDASGRPTLELRPAYDVTVYPYVTHDGPPRTWTVERSGTIEVSPFLYGAEGTDGTVRFTVKREGELLGKASVTLENGFPAIPTLEMDVTAGELLYLDVSCDAPALADGIVSPWVRIVFYQTVVDPDGTEHTVRVERWALATVRSPVEVGVFPQPYRGWGAAGYDGAGVRGAAAIVEAELYAQALNPISSKVWAFQPVPAMGWWQGPTDWIYVAAASMATSRQSKDSIDLSEPIGNGYGVPRVSRTAQVSLVGSASIVGASKSWAKTYSKLDFMDLNGDRYPDVVGEKGVQYTRPTGGLDGYRIANDFDRVRHTTAGAWLLSAGVNAGNPAAVEGDQKANVDTSPTESAENAKSGTAHVALGVSGSYAGGSSDTDDEYADLNGDGLLDRVHVEGEGADAFLAVRLNLGYEFGPEEVWGRVPFNEGESTNESLGLSAGYQSGSYAFGGGVSYTKRWSRTGRGFADMNGDGLPDAVRSDSIGLYVALNTGAGFAPEEQWSGAQGTHDWAADIGAGDSAQWGGGVYFTITIGPLCYFACYLIINPGEDFSETIGKQTISLADVDGDGYADDLKSTGNSEISVARGRGGRTNLLSRIDRPMGSSVAIDYQRTGNTYDQPQNRWVVSRIEVFDGVAGDSPAVTGRGQDMVGADYLVQTFAYEGGYYDRNEREFYGFSRVIQTELDTRGLDAAALGNATPYRRTTRTYRNHDYYEKGLESDELVEDVSVAPAAPYKETVFVHAFRDVSTGQDVTDRSSETATIFPRLRRVERHRYEGDIAHAVSTYQTMEYDAYGNIRTFFDSGGSGPADDLWATVSYTGSTSGLNPGCLGAYVVGKADSIVVTSNATTLRRRQASFDCTTGDLKQLREYVDGATVAVTDFTYGEDGNLSSVIGPPNLAGERYALAYRYDDVVGSHVVRVDDSFGYYSTMDYDYRFGSVASTTDENGNTIANTYDAFGRLSTVVGPYEAGLYSYTLRFTYLPGAYPPAAMTEHLDPERDPGDPIVTVLFTDGLGRVLQSKKDATVQTAAGQPGEDVMVVSGRVVYDHLGRTLAAFYPTTEPLGSPLSFDEAVDGTPPTTSRFDVLDRPTETEFPDGTTLSNAYGIESNAAGPQLVITTTDAELQVKKTWRDLRDVTVMVQDYVDGSPLTTTYLHDAVGQLTDVVDARGNHTVIGYDWTGRRRHVDNPDTGRNELVFDPAGNAVRRITPELAAAGLAIEMRYEYNRLRSVRYPKHPENDVTYTYGGPELRGQAGNRVGRITLLADAAGLVQRAYGKLGEIVTEARTARREVTHHPGTFTTSYRYDTWGRLRELQYPDGELVRYEYDSGGQVQAVAGARPYVDRIDYDQFGQRVHMQLGNGVVTDYSYDPATRRLSSMLSTGGPEVGRFQDVAYEYDDVGNVTAIRNQAPIPSTGFGGTTTQSFVYDGLYRLVHAEGGFSGHADHETYSLDVAYDGIHNILRKTQAHWRHDTPNGQLPVKSTTYDWIYAYDGAQPHAPTAIGDRTYTYDRNGNQTGWQSTENGTRRTIEWDEDNRVRSVADNGRVTSFVYDDTGERVVKNGIAGETIYVNQYWSRHGGGIDTKHVFVGNTRIASVVSPGVPDLEFIAGAFPGQGIYHWSAEAEENAQNLYKNKHLVAQQLGIPADFVYFYHPDHVGSTAFVTDERAELYEHLEYFPFGETWIEESSNTSRTRHLFTGKELDVETGLYYFGARYYEPRISAWLSPDPGLEVLVSDTRTSSPRLALGGIYNPANLAVYTYSHDRPLRLVDPDGRWTNPLEDMHIRSHQGGVHNPRSNTYGMVRHYADGRPKPHQGIDLRAIDGTDTFAVGSGTVVAIDRVGSGDYGRFIVYRFKYKYTVGNFLYDVFTGRWGEIGTKMERNGKTYFAMHAHLSAIDPRLGTDARHNKIEEGQVIGQTGSTGNAAGMRMGERHLHFETRSRQWVGRGLGGRTDPAPFTQGLNREPVDNRGMNKKEWH